MQVLEVQEGIDIVLEMIGKAGTCKRPKGNPGGSPDTKYADIVSAFDIETTRIERIEQSVMYVWQWAFTVDLVLIGRTWDEFLYCVECISEELGDRILPVYVHNLSYEFQFLAGIYPFTPDEVFAVKSRKVLYCKMIHIEFRCSAIHSNMSLDAFTHAMGVDHAKLGGFDYAKKRYAWTPLTENELKYCVHDVVGLVEALTVELEKEGDNLYTIPLTSTGYVRRDVKRAMKSAQRYVQDIIPDYEVFQLLRKAFRGGDVHANRWFSGDILRDARSADRSSSYPDVILNCRFPMSKFEYLGSISLEKYYEYVDSGKAVLMQCSFQDITLQDETFPVPYLSESKTEVLLDFDKDNGRILNARYIETVITDIDFAILSKEYTWSHMVIVKAFVSRYGWLPAGVRNENINYYERKSRLKGDPGQEYYYNRAKNKLNSIYGLMAQNPLGADIKFRIGEGEGGFVPRELGESDYDKKWKWLSYAWAVWVTAWARLRLHEGIWLVHETPGAHVVYVDTDSVKYIGDVDWTDYNKRRQLQSTEHGACACDVNGKMHYMGVYEADGEYKRFRTWGAKKYAYEDVDGKLHVTIAGVSKSKGAAELAASGGLEAFRPGMIFREAGGRELIYNDIDYGEYFVDGHYIYITRNVVIRDSTYKVSLSQDYEDLLNYINIYGEDVTL